MFATVKFATALAERLPRKTAAPRVAASAAPDPAVDAIYLKVGTVILAMVMAFAIERRYRTFDFLGGDLEYKRFWSDHTLGKMTVVLYPKGLAGWLGANRARYRERSRRFGLRVASYEQRRRIKRTLLGLVHRA